MVLALAALVSTAGLQEPGFGLLSPAAAAPVASISGGTDKPSATVAAPGSRTTPPRSPGAVAPTTPLQLVRRLLGIPRRMAVGGSRGGMPLSVCLISPAITAAPQSPSSQTLPLALLPVATPTLLADGALNEVRLERNGQLLWQRRASSTQPIEGAIPWPLQPLQPGESVQLVLRPRGASSGDVATIELRAPSSADLQRTSRRIQSLGDSPQRWLAAIDQAAGSDSALAMALLTHPQAPAGVTALSRQLSCGGTVGALQP